MPFGPTSNLAPKHNNKRSSIRSNFDMWPVLRSTYSHNDKTNGTFQAKALGKVTPDKKARFDSIVTN